jgi:hypothetical protein
LTNLPITSASTTKFCSIDIKVGGETLYLDGNSKITWDNGTFSEPRPNSFSLIQVEDCPQATETCSRSCYVWNLEKYRPELHALYKKNSLAIRDVVAQPLQAVAHEMAEHIRTFCRGGFRWHVSGDIFSMTYARFIAEVCRRSREVGQWIYTRSFAFCGPLVPISTEFGGNLAVNLSCDRDNWEDAARLASATGFRLCYLTLDGKVPQDLPRGSVIFPDYSLRRETEEGRQWFKSLLPEQKAMVCPVDFYGKSERIRCGPCKRCLK